jgi:hypothetical protein
MAAPIKHQPAKRMSRAAEGQEASASEPKRAGHVPAGPFRIGGAFVRWIG